MAKKAEQNTAAVKSASFHNAATAALFGVDDRELGTVTFHDRGIITVQFAKATATRVSDKLFKIIVAVDPASTAPEAPADEAQAVIDALKGKWESDDEAAD
ncbi:hypothetical protein [Sphingobium yanoikuyae]|uniref:hypothetical protein n=1 Tax=Sphingobium yanoikuyae TaxID=13690 RepID=UPI0028A6433C|nr:hypothetical protein [Sphingobium yanoikuyae]